MGRKGATLQFGVELHADEPGMVRPLDDFRQDAVRRQAAEVKAGALHHVAIGCIDLVTMAVAFGNGRLAIDFTDPGAWRQHRLIGAQPHGAAQVLVGLADLHRVAAHPFGHQPDHRIIRRTELGGRRAGHAAEVAGRLDNGHLHAKADAEIGHGALAGELDGANHALRPALPKGARHQDAVDVLQPLSHLSRIALKRLPFDPIERHRDAVGQAAVMQRLDQGLIGVLQGGIFADDGD